MTLVSISAAFHLGNFFLVCRPHPTVDDATQGSHAQLRRWSPRVALDRHVPGDGLRGLSGLAEHAAHERPQLECCAPLPPTATTWAAPRARYAPRRVQPSTARVRPRTVLRLGASREQSCVLARACSRVLCRRVLQGCWGGGGGGAPRRRSARMQERATASERCPVMPTAPPYPMRAPGANLMITRANSLSNPAFWEATRSTPPLHVRLESRPLRLKGA